MNAVCNIYPVAKYTQSQLKKKCMDLTVAGFLSPDVVVVVGGKVYSCSCCRPTAWTRSATRLRRSGCLWKLLGCITKTNFSQYSQYK